MRLAVLIEENAHELAAIQTLENGKTFFTSLHIDVLQSAAAFRYYGGWADKNHGKTIEVNPDKFAYTVHEPIGGELFSNFFPFFSDMILSGWLHHPMELSL
jgi:aldehyde dehydrogenase (NAD+)